MQHSAPKALDADLDVLGVYLRVLLLGVDPHERVEQRGFRGALHLFSLLVFFSWANIRKSLHFHYDKQHVSFHPIKHHLNKKKSMIG